MDGLGVYDGFVGGRTSPLEAIKVLKNKPELVKKHSKAYKDLARLKDLSRTLDIEYNKAKKSSLRFQTSIMKKPGKCSQRKLLLSFSKQKLKT